ncbi:MAG: hypothetical protein IE889_03440 [Campylobacterales bacterium]|nr:hypothetical protein [Campylobacterales bacterium]
MKNLFILVLLSVISVADIHIVTSDHRLISVSKEQIAALYLGKIDTIQGVKVLPIDNSNAQSYQEFYRKVVNKSPEQLHAYWAKQLFSSNRRPPQKLSDGEIEKRLQTNIPIISYSSTDLSGNILLTTR